ncbi:MAG: Na(+)/H(+) antiporter NhaA [Planctomycetota bacterium]|nr:MAG: Na(+)/H(+) antiporter NhaA [Planctomycetota bacterium]
MTHRRRLIHLLAEFSLPLILGVLAALAVANAAPELYDRVVDGALPWLGERVRVHGHPLSLHFLVNDVFMVLFFGIAAKEITESVLPGGPLNDPRKAVNPLLGMLGGVLAPIGVFFSVIALAGRMDLRRGWGIPTATDIALAWLVARLVFGRRHPAVNYLLLMAVGDDAVGLAIIAIFYPDPRFPVEPQWLGLVAAGMAIAWGLRRLAVRRWPIYVVLAGVPSWLGLLHAHLHPALALVFVVPFMPGPRHDLGLYEDVREEDGRLGVEGSARVPAIDAADVHNPLFAFEHHLRVPVELGLFFFGFANAGVRVTDVGTATFAVLASLLLGKTLGITLCSWAAHRLGMPLPDGMRLRHLVVAAMIASIGLTVALFVAAQAYPAGSTMLRNAKMGCLLSAGAALPAWLLGRALRVREPAPGRAAGAPGGVQPDAITAARG